MAIASQGFAADSTRSEKRHFRTVIVGGGTAGIAMAAQLRAVGQNHIALIELSTKHYYQPLWTLAGGGIVSKEMSARDESDYIPKDVTWIRDRVVTFEPERNELDPVSRTIC